MSKKGKVSESVKYNETTLPEFIDICKMSQKELKDFLEDKLVEAGYEKVVSNNGYLYAKGDIPILLTAHMDTVHKKQIKTFTETMLGSKRRLSSPEGIGGDDRCGIYMILQIIKEKKCSILFCEDEEKGGLGSRKFCRGKYLAELKELKYMIELDRAHKSDAVFYRCDNKDFTKFICKNTGYKESFGSFSDISTLAPAAGIAAVNLSCGYYNAHTSTEYVLIEEMLETIEAVKKLLDVECEQFKYVEKVYSYNHDNFRSKYDNWRNRRGYYDDYYKICEAAAASTYEEEDDDDGYSYYANNSFSKNLYNNKVKQTRAERFAKKEYDQMVLYVEYEDPETFRTKNVQVTGSTKDELWRKFFQEYSNVCMDLVVDYDYDYL